ncbi:PTS transporter subunit EIIC [Konateibacter massiliensis]|uniref:PTS transporter subunit EIIC n=1 Tax=Konateibacter massiliensis TaxID=2002841 RepID=UPI000C150985|nr:PTS transporter subunit EIIC [Konateibacter massiliensis]
MKYTGYVKELTKALGGSENILAVTHCATRLRFQLKDTQIVNKEQVQALSETVGVLEANGTFQVIIGTHVGDVYEDLIQTYGELGKQDLEDQKEEQEEAAEKKPVIDKILSTLSAIFTPYIPVLASAGIIKGILALCSQAGWLSTEADIYHILSAAGNSLIYFFPILLSYTAAKQFKANPFIGVAIGAALLEPNLTAVNITGETLHILGLNFTAQDFSSTVIPIILGMWAYSYLEKGLKKILPKTIQLILVPFLCLVIMVPAMVMIFGPIGFGIAKGIAAAYSALLSVGIIPMSIIFGAFFIYVIAIGAHWVVLPIQLSILAEQGYEYSLSAGGLGNYAVLGVTLAVLVMTKDKQTKTMASSAAFVNFLSGVTEPSIYGILIKNKMYFVALSIAAGIGGLICGIFNCYITNFAFTGLFGLPAFASSPTAVPYFVAVAVTIAVAFILTVIFTKRAESRKM